MSEQKEQPPFKRGDCVIDDNGEIGYCLWGHTSAHWDENGKLVMWGTRINYRWDQDSYGETRQVINGDIEPYNESA